MKSRSAKRRFLQLIEETGHEPGSLSPSGGFDLMLRFYRGERFEGCPLDKDGDMLLYQWGCYDWSGAGETFHLNITRQLIDGNGEDENFRQLSLTFEFSPDETLRSLKSGNRWCHSPDELNEFRVFIERSPAFNTTAGMTPSKVDLSFGVAG